MPLSIEASVGARDPDNDKMSYVWHIGGKTVETKEPKLQTTLSTAGDYAIYAEVKDDKGAESKSNIVSVYAGNEAPSVAIHIKGNQTFYFPNVPVNYAVTVNDKEDGTTLVDSNAMVTADYREGNDKAGVPAGHQIITEVMQGKNLMESLDCKACHKVAEKSVGPAFTAVSEKYQKQAGAIIYLANKIIKGGGGVWGDAVMSAHPNLSEGDAKQIVTWVLSLANTSKQKSLPVAGAVPPTLNKPAIPNGVLYLTATYTDKGGQNIKPLSGSGFAALRSSNIDLGTVKHVNDASGMNYNGMHMMIPNGNDSWFAIDSVDLSGIAKATMSYGWQDAPTGSNAFEFHLDAPNGKLLGLFTVEANKDIKAPIAMKSSTITITPVADGKMHTVYVVKKSSGGKPGETIAITGLSFLYKKAKNKKRKMIALSSSFLLL